MVVSVSSAASSFGFPFQPKHERFRFLREIQNFLQGMTKTLGIGLLQQTITWYMVVGKLIIIPAVGH